MLNDLSFSDLTFRPSQIAGNEDGWVLLSENTFAENAGRVVILKQIILGNESITEDEEEVEIEIIEFMLDGEEGSFSG